MLVSKAAKMKAREYGTQVARLIGRQKPWHLACAALGLGVLGLGVWTIAQQSAQIEALALENQRQEAAFIELSRSIKRLESASAAYTQAQTQTQATGTADGSTHQFDKDVLSRLDTLNDDTSAANAALASFATRMANAETTARTMQDDLATLQESVTAVRDQLEARLRFLEQSPPVKGIPLQAPVPAAQNGELQALEIYVRQLADRVDGLAEAEAARAQVIATQKPAMPALVPVAGAAAAHAEIARLEQSAIAAFQTLDSQFQIILERLEELADGAHAQSVLQQVSTLLLAADPGLGIRMVGYADFDGTDSVSNRITSQKRADFILDQLTRLGVPSGRLLAVGKATEDRVVDSDATGNGNRRAIFEPFLLKDTSG